MRKRIVLVLLAITAMVLTLSASELKPSEERRREWNEKHLHRAMEDVVRHSL